MVLVGTVEKLEKQKQKQNDVEPRAEAEDDADTTATSNNTGIGHSPARRVGHPELSPWLPSGSDRLVYTP